MSCQAADDEFLAAFEACSYPFSQWNHRAHLRMAWLYLTRCSLTEAVHRIRLGILRYNLANNVLPGYHETLTVALMRLIHHEMKNAPAQDTWEAFFMRHPKFSDKETLLKYYTRDLINSDKARRWFVEPDVSPLPSEG